MKSFSPGGIASVFGASGAIGGALADALDQSGAFERVMRFSRHGPLPLDLADECSISRAAQRISEDGRPLRLAFVATGFLHGKGYMPEKSLRQIDAAHMAHAFAINAIGPALLLKHVLPLLAGGGKSVFAMLSARVGSISDNHLGGWHAYRASKAALNQIVRTSAIELARRQPEAICIALHPGTVQSSLSEPFARAGLDIRSAREAARDLLAVIDALGPDANGAFRDQYGKPIEW